MLWQARNDTEVRAEIGETVFCIIYSLVWHGTLRAERILKNWDFFHKIGFRCEGFFIDNWLADGILINYSDLIPPVGCHGHFRFYCLLVRQEFEADVLGSEKERLLQERGLRPPKASKIR